MGCRIFLYASWCIINDKKSGTCNVCAYRSLMDKPWKGLQECVCACIKWPQPEDDQSCLPSDKIMNVWNSFLHSPIIG